MSRLIKNNPMLHYNYGVLGIIWGSTHTSVLGFGTPFFCLGLGTPFSCWGFGTLFIYLGFGTPFFCLGLGTPFFCLDLGTQILLCYIYQHTQLFSKITLLGPCGLTYYFFVLVCTRTFPIIITF